MPSGFSAQFGELLNPPRPPRVLVVGDAMLDRYVWGDVHRVSPEAPIPVLDVAQEEERLGGAASVAALLAALGAQVALAAVLAEDGPAERIRRLLSDHAVDAEPAVTDPERRTTVKERLLGRTQSRHPQQLVRVDRDAAAPLRRPLEAALLRSVRERLEAVDAVLLSDYGKGACSDRLVQELACAARAAGKPLVADPARGVPLRRYAGATAVTPNRFEAGAAVGLPIRSPEDGLEAARRILQYDLDAAVVTLDRDGVAWADRTGREQLFPVRPRQVYDITGAGDMVLAALGYSLALGADWPAAIEMANLAGGLEVERLGVAPVTREELALEALSSGLPANRKIVSLAQLEEQLRDRREAGQRIVMSNGCFDLLHPGHVASLQHARAQGDCLVVALNSDRSVAAIKGPGRPLIDERGRAEMLAALGCVDYVVIFDDPSVEGLVARLRPDVLVKSAEYAPEEVVGGKLVEQAGGRVVLAPRHGPYSTSWLVQRIRDDSSESL